MGVLVLGGIALLQVQIWITFCIIALIAVVSWSYWQTIHAYPSGGGSYIVASENLGRRPGLIAASALLIDYVLTVSVSVAAGVAALVSAYPALHSWLVPLSAAAILVLTFGNLRGVRESGALFSIPTYGFLLSAFTMLGFAIFRSLTQPAVAQTVVGEAGSAGSEANVLVLFVVLRAFAAGCTALTGIEAVSNGVQAFKSPESTNASKTLALMAITLALLFLGIGYFALHLPSIELLATKNPAYTTLFSQVAAWSFGGNQTIGFYCVQYSTAALLILAANTAFADFPRLASLLARDGFLPRSLMRQGDRLVFQNGILLLAVAATALVWAYHGELDQLLPLYAIGVFTAFTLSQLGMIVHWKRLGARQHMLSMTVNLIGAVMTGIVAVILLVTKFFEGAWLIGIIVCLFYWMLSSIKGRYQAIAKKLTGRLGSATAQRKHSVLLLVPRVHQGILESLQYAKKLHADDFTALHVTINPQAETQLREDWEKYGAGVPLVIVESPYRSLIEPILEYVDAMSESSEDSIVTVIVPEAVPSKWIYKPLQENIAGPLKRALGNRRNVVVTNVRYFLD